jgi:hypothetical protein
MVFFKTFITHYLLYLKKLLKNISKNIKIYSLIRNLKFFFNKNFIFKIKFSLFILFIHS